MPKPEGPSGSARKVMLILSCLILIMLGYDLFRFWALYNQGKFGFHDLSLINGFMSNAVYFSNPFFVTQYNSNHFAFQPISTYLLEDE